jgi:hypothetical protein
MIEHSSSADMSSQDERLCSSISAPERRSQGTVGDGDSARSQKVNRVTTRGGVSEHGRLRGLWDLRTGKGSKGRAGNTPC